MNFEDVVLPNYVLANWYEHVLIEEKQSVAIAAKSTESMQPQIKFLGGNKKQFILVVNDTNAVFLTDENLTFLTNLLAACKMTIEDVAIINNTNNNYSYLQVANELNPQFILLMGVDAAQFKLPLVFPVYKIQQYKNVPMLIAADVSKYIGNSTEVKIEKSKLWISLKEMLGI